MAQEVGIAPTPRVLQTRVQTNYTIPGIVFNPYERLAPIRNSHQENEYWNETLVKKEMEL